MMIKDFKDIIQDYKDIVLEETQQLLDEIKEVQSNKYINEVQGLGDIATERNACRCCLIIVLHVI